MLTADEDDDSERLAADLADVAGALVIDVRRAPAFAQSRLAVRRDAIVNLRFVKAC